MNSQLNFTEAISQSGFETIDFIIWMFYIILLVSLGLFLSRSKAGQKKTPNDYFLAGNTLTWWAVGASLIAANISAEQFIGMAGTGYADGIAIAAYEIIAAITLVIIGKFILPLMMERRIITVPQFLRERYNDGVGLAFSILWLFLYVFVNLTSVAWLGALGIEQILGLQGMEVAIGNMYISMRTIIILALFITTGFYSISGGQTSVAWADVMQATFIIGGGFVTAYFALCAVAGDDGSFIDGFNKIYTYLTTGNYAKDTHFHLIIQQSHNAKAFNNVPGIAAIVGGVWLANFGYWGFNQYIVQKGFSARSVTEAQKGFLFAGFLKLLIPFIVLLPGICAFYMVQNGVDVSRFMGRVAVPDDAYPWFIRNFTPTGVKGLSFAALTAAIISSLASMCNSTSTLFTMDIYKKYINKTASDHRLVNIGRTSSIFALVITFFAVIPLMRDSEQAYQYIQEYSAFIYPGVITVFALGLFWKRASSSAAAWTALATIPLGILFRIWLPNVAFQFRAGYVFIVLFIVFIVISMISQQRIRCERPMKEMQDSMMKWANILGALGLSFIILALIVTIWHRLLPIDATPDNHFIAYLDDIGFHSFYFFGVLVGCSAIFLYSNAKDRVCDPKAMRPNLALFKTPKGYTYGTIIICIVSVLFYILFW